MPGHGLIAPVLAEPRTYRPLS